jgi:hypothetical protein
LRSVVARELHVGIQGNIVHRRSPTADDAGEGTADRDGWAKEKVRDVPDWSPRVLKDEIDGGSA